MLNTLNSWEVRQIGEVLRDVFEDYVEPRPRRQRAGAEVFPKLAIDDEQLAQEIAYKLSTIGFDIVRADPGPGG